MGDLTSLLGRFGRGRVAQLAVRQALASSSRRAEGSSDGGAAVPADDSDGEEAHLCVAPSGASVTSHTPVTVPLEVEYSQASQSSQRYHDEAEESCAGQASWEESCLPEIPEEQRSCDGSPRAYGAVSLPASAGGSPAVLGPVGASRVSDSGAASEQPSPVAAAREEDDIEEEALLLCSMLNGGAGQRPLRPLGSPISPPALRRLRGELQQEMSGSVLLSPLAAVSEHSFEDAAGLHALAGGGGSVQAVTSPGAAPGYEEGGGVPAQRGGSARVAEEEAEPPTDEQPSAARRPRMGRRAGVQPLRRAATPLTAALGEGLGSGEKSAPREAAGDTEHDKDQHAEQVPELQKPKPPGREGMRSMQAASAIKQQIWSFDSIPLGRATIPSGHSPQAEHLPPELPGARLKKPGRPTTAGPLAGRTTPRLSVSSQPPPPAGPTSSRAEGRSAAAHSSGLARRGSKGHAGAAAQDAAAAAAVPTGGLRVRVRSSGQLQRLGREGGNAGAAVEAGPPSASEAGNVCAEDALQTVRGCFQPAQGGTSGTALWPAKQELTPAQSDTAHGKYSHERFLAHLDKLSLAMASRLQKRQHAQADMIDKVTSFEDSVRTQRLNGFGGAGGEGRVQQPAAEEQTAGPAVPALEPEEFGPILGWVHHASKAGKRAGEDRESISSPRLKAVLARRQHGSQGNLAATGVPAGSTSGACASPPPTVAAKAGVASEAVPAEEPRSQGPSPGPQSCKLDSKPGQSSAAAGPANCGPAASSPAAAMEGSPGAQPAAKRSPTPALLSTEIASPAHEQRDCSHGASAMADEGPAGLRLERLKPIMQVKLEQDLAIKYLSAQQRPYEASPLPLSSMEPHMAELEQRAQQRSEELHEKRLELLRSQERPFSFYQRDKERQQAALAAATAASEGSKSSSRPRSASSPPFIAHPVPVSTTEARYALLVAEMQLQNRTVKGRSLVTPSISPGAPRRDSLRPATAEAAQQPSTLQLLPGRAGSVDCRVAGEAPGTLSSDRTVGGTVLRHSSGGSTL